MRKYLRIVDNNRATKGIRFANFVIDRIIFNLFFFAIGFLGVLIDKIIGSYYLTNLILKASEINRFIDILVTSLLFSVYTFLMEYFTKGRTIGKYITGTKVITTDGQIPTLNEFFIRNISRAVPFDALSFLGETGWHDSWSDTRVVNIKNYESERQVKSEIETLGTKEIV
ncbi:RDD family protein [Chryseobacterium sp. SSA4.19]|uniref:RDD family protein n=1 Tax=Chryseobacterium sp. SSA4.19 TaxID=2919915 RepID=UPI001F4D8769|nr:RDD family protein [Chryseobacterium sp. SSA4.19]MCJ8152196.1 RDD family protein [Chryseobacterium sp. SSA4.19]